MLLWDYDEANLTLNVRYVEKGNTHKVTKYPIDTAKQLAFWLKHYSNLDSDSFKLESKIQSDLLRCEDDEN